jgi:hypothetical protein
VFELKVEASVVTPQGLVTYYVWFALFIIRPKRITSVGYFVLITKPHSATNLNQLNHNLENIIHSMEQASRTRDASNPHHKEEQGGPDVQAEEIQAAEIGGRDEREKGEGRANRLIGDHQRVHPKNLVVLSFRSLQLRRISELQSDLLRLAVETASDIVPDDKTKEVDEKLRAYCESAIISAPQNLLTWGTAKALRNYETLSEGAVPFIPPETGLIGVMEQGAVNPPERQPRIFGFAIQPAIFSSILFSPSYGRDLRKRFVRSSSDTLSDAIKSLVPETPSPIPKQTEDLAAGNWGYRGLDEHLRDQNQAFSSRLNMAAFGGTAFYIPMLIMTLDPSTVKGLLTILISTIVFGFLLAVSATDSTGKDVLAATAAYAGVLVVFAGSLPIPAS